MRCLKVDLYLIFGYHKDIVLEKSECSNNIGKITICMYNKCEGITWLVYNQNRITPSNSIKISIFIYDI